MYKKQMTIQRILCLAAIIASVVVFLYALGVMTDLYDSLYRPNDLKDLITVEGSSVYIDMQGFNQKLLMGSIGMILLGVFLFVTNTHIRRRYYIGNYVATGAYAVASAALAAFSHAEIEVYKAQFLQVDFEALKFFTEMFPENLYTESTFWFGAHYFVFGLLLLVAVLLIANACWKVYLMHKEAKLVAAGRGIAA